MFKIVVCIKQVPDTTDIKWTENNTIQREGLDSIINPYDLSAIQTAIEIKKNLKDVEIIAVSMGPAQASDALNYAIALGCDDAYLLNDKKFAASDTLATAYTLSLFVQKYVPDFKLIICGQQAVDGDTAQTPSSLAEKLCIPQLTNCKKINEVSDNTLNVTTENKHEICEVIITLPALIAIDVQGTYLHPKINDFIKAQNKSVIELSAADLSADFTKIGIKGSPTYVKAAFRAVKSRINNQVITNSIDETAEALMREINLCKEANE